MIDLRGLRHGRRGLAGLLAYTRTINPRQELIGRSSVDDADYSGAICRSWRVSVRDVCDLSISNIPGFFHAWFLVLVDCDPIRYNPTYPEEYLIGFDKEAGVFMASERTCGR
jgi:hypothetical protein